MIRAIYARVSTEDQTTLTQLERLRPLAPGAWEFVDEAVSGRAASRPKFEEMLRHIRAGEVLEVYVTKIDRLGRSSRAVLEFFEEAKRLGVKVVVVDQSVDTSTPSGQFLVGILAVTAQFEAEITVERSKERQRSIRDHHARTGEWTTRSGRPPWRPRRQTPELVSEIVRLRDDFPLKRPSWNEIARRVHVPAGSARKWYSAAKRARAGPPGRKTDAIKGV